MAITFGNIGGAEPSTVTFRAATVVIPRGSTNEQQEIIAIGDPQSSLGIARVTAAAPVSTEFGLIVRIAGGPSSAFDLQFRPVFSSTSADNPVQISGNSTVVQGTSPWVISGNSTSIQGTSPWVIAGNSTVAPLAGSTWATRPIQSSAADLQMTATPLAGSTWNVRPIQSSAADLQATVTPLAGSTWNVRALNSSAGDFLVTISGNSTVAPLAGSTWNVRALQSSAADLQATVTPVAGSTWNVRPIQSSAADLLATVTIGTNLQSTSAPSSNSSGLTVRLVVDNILTTASTNAFASTSFSIQSSGAALRSYVTAYSITSTAQAPNKICFYSSNVMLWPIVLAALSSAVSGVNLAVSPPGYLFRSIGANDDLTIRTGGSTGGGYKIGVSYFRAP